MGSSGKIGNDIVEFNFPIEVISGMILVGSYDQTNSVIALKDNG